MKTINEKGISLIALIITVVIVLIIASFSIAQISGRGVISKAKNATEKYKEYVNVEEQELKDANDLINQELLGKAVFKLSGSETTMEVGRTQGETLKNYYGQTVDSSFFSSNEGIDWSWQLFYDDENYVFLIASNYVPNNKLPMNGNVGYGPTDLVKKRGVNEAYNATFNSDENYNDGIMTEGTIYKAKSRSTAITNNRLTEKYLKWPALNLESTNENIETVAYMMDINKWSKFAGACRGAQAIGGPTLELFIKSWNASHNSDQLQGYDTMTNNTNYNSLGYKIWNKNTGTWENEGETGDLGTTTNMWFIKENDKARAYWMASLSSSGSNNVRYVHYDGYISYRSSYSSAAGFRPVVSIPKSQIK